MNWRLLLTCTAAAVVAQAALGCGSSTETSNAGGSSSHSASSATTSTTGSGGATTGSGGMATTSTTGTGGGCGALTDCNGNCVDTQSDVNNCGMCGKACMSGEMCAAGMCAPCLAHVESTSPKPAAAPDAPPDELAEPIAVDGALDMVHGVAPENVTEPGPAAPSDLEG